MRRCLQFASTAVACAAMVLSPAIAHAHAMLVSSNPGENQVLPHGPVHVSLKFNSRVDGSRSAITLVDPHGATRTLVLSTGDGQDTVEADAGALPAGQYKLEWQALSTDGHITRGQIPFSVR